MKSQYIIGVDPGKKGGIAVYNTTGEIETLSLADATEHDIAKFLLFRTPGTAFIEEVFSSPQQGVVSAFSFGQSYGGLRMAIVCNQLKLHTVRPQKWRSAMRVRKVRGALGKNDTEKKRATKERAQQLFPSLTITHGIADALLLMEFGRIFLGEFE